MPNLRRFASNIFELVLAPFKSPSTCPAIAYQCARAIASVALAFDDRRNPSQLIKSESLHGQFERGKDADDRCE